MKKSKKIEKNKKRLDDYLSDFEHSKSMKMRDIFTEEDFDCGLCVFQGKMKLKISMPKVGKKTLKYWTSRGWSESDAKEKRIKIKSDPNKSPMNLNFWIKRGMNKEEAQYKVRSFRKMNIEYWLEKGYTKEQAEIKRKNFQLKSNKKFIDKYKSDEEFKKKCDSKKSNTMIYWTSKGYSEEESIEKISNRQRTFSKKICIEKYGKEEGLKIWKERQKKWKKSLNESDYNGVDGKLIPISDRIKRYNIEKLINSLSLKDKELFIKLFKKCKTIEEFIKSYSDTFKSSDELSLYKILLPIKKLKILHEFYNTTDSYIMSLIIPKITRVKSLYSNYSWFNNHICRSDSEYILANFLFRNNIKYVYEKKYNQSKYRCDFYLNDYNLYVEYLGMWKGSDDNPYQTKLNFLNKRNINYISSNNVDELKSKIIKYVNNTNKRPFKFI